MHFSFNPLVHEIANLASHSLALCLSLSVCLSLSLCLFLCLSLSPLSLGVALPGRSWLFLFYFTFCCFSRSMRFYPPPPRNVVGGHIGITCPSMHVIVCLGEIFWFNSTFQQPLLLWQVVRPRLHRHNYHRDPGSVMREDWSATFKVN